MGRARSAIDAGWEVHLVSGVTSKDIVNKIESEGVFFHSIPLKRGSYSIFSVFLTLVFFLRLVFKINPDILHCITTVPIVTGGLISRFIKSPVIYSVPGTGWVFTSPDKKAFFIKNIVVFFYRLVSFDKSFFVFENHDDLDLFYDKKIIKDSNGLVILGAGVDTSIYSPDMGKNFVGKLSFIFAGRLLKSKGLEDFIEASKILFNRGVDLEITVCGIYDKESPDRIPKNKINEWKELPFINWLGQQHNIHEILKKSDIVVLPTRYGEGVPRILIEGASSAMPLIASNVPGCREIVKHGVNGLLVPPGDIDELCTAMMYFVDDRSLCQSYGNEGRRLVLSDFDQSIVNRKTLDLYENIIGL